MWKYTLVEKATGDAIEADEGMVEWVTGVELGYIDWVLEHDAKSRTGTGKCGSEQFFQSMSQIPSDPSGTEDLFAKWNRTRQR